MTDTKYFAQLYEMIKIWSRELGFQQVGVTDTNLKAFEVGYEAWIEKGYHGSMDWLVENGDKRLKPELLHPNTIRIISVRMDYLPPETEQIKILKSADKAYVSRYALGRDYHKLIRKRLANLANKIEAHLQLHKSELSVNQRPFVDSAPVLERPLAEKAGLGWIGKHTLLLNKSAGSWFFLGELYTNLPLPVNENKITNDCGECSACLKVCPTDAFPKPYVLDATRCISFLTIENKGAIPEKFREPMGNRVFGCDDCQAICPWNKYAQPTGEKDFLPRHKLDSSSLLSLFKWDENTFLNKTAGSPIRRIGFERWQRNLAVGLGNAPSSADIVNELENQRKHCSSLVEEHINWALAQQANPKRKRLRKIKASI